MNSFKFIDLAATSKMKHSAASYLPMGGFYGDYGKPNTVIFGNNLVLFWPDDWQRVVGGQKGVGHFVQWFQQSPISLKKVSGGNDADSNLTVSGWLVGHVVGYERDADTYTIQFDRSSIIAGSDCQHLSESYWEDYQSASTITADYTNLSVPLDRVIHLWVDLRNKNKIGSIGNMSVGDERLTFSFADVGAFIKIWWSRYSKHFYGRIVEYDSTRKIHSVVYEDTDKRSYDMTTRDYEIIFPSQNLSKQIAAVASDAEAAKLVASWHKKKQGSTADRPRSDSNVAQRVEAAIPRPNAAQNLGISIHQLEVINQFAIEGGLESLFQSLSDLNQAPPTCRAIMLNMQLTYQLKRFIGPTRYQDLVWEAKEGIPCALSRYQEAQIKDLTVKEFNDICLAIKDIVISVESDDPAQKQAPNKVMLVSVEYMRLTVASKLLSCSQLQKRYSGLLMIKDVIDTIFNKLSLLVDKRYQFLGAKRDAKAKSSSSSSSTASASSAAASKPSLSFSQMDSWLIENDIVKSVFGESLHQDLVARSDIILAYMAQRGILTEQHVELIWSASKGAHEAVSRVLFLLILVLVPTLAPNLRLYLFNLISCTPIKDYSEQLLHFIKSYTIQSIIASKEESKKESRESSSPMRVTVPSSYQQQQSSQLLSESTQRDKDSQYGGLTAGKKGTVVNAPSRQWLGFGVLWHFIQDNPGPVYTGTSLLPNKTYQQPPVFGGTKIPSNVSMIGESEIIDENLIDLAIQLLVDLLQDEFKDEREIVMLKCLDNIQASMSVPVSLQLLRKTLALYPSQGKSWFGGITNRQSFGRVTTIQNQVEKLIKSQKLMEIVFQDLEKYHRSLGEPILPSDDNGFPGQDSYRSAGEFGNMVQSRSAQDLASLNDRRLQTNGQFSRTSHLKGIVERLDFLKFIVSRSTVKLNESQTILLWRALGERAATVETLEKLCTWIDTLVVREDKQLIVLLSSLSQENDISAPDLPSQLAVLSPSSGENSRSDNDTSATVLVSAFEEGVLAKLFDDYILKWANNIDRVEYLSRPAIARLCFKLFLLVNILSKSIRVNTETGVWIRVGPLNGLPVLWRIAMDGSTNVASTAIVLLIELHHRTNHRLKLSDNIKAVFLRQCFKQLSIAIQSLQSDDFVGSSRAALLNLTDTAPEDTNAGTLAHSSHGNKASKAAAGVDAIDWFEDGEYLPSLSDISRRVARLVQAVRLFIHRFHFSPTKLITVTVLAGRNESAVCTFSMKASDSVSLLRQKIANHFKDTTDSINLFKYASKQPFSTNSQPPSAPPSIVERDDFSLQQAKFAAAVEYVLVKRKEVVVPQAGNAPSSSEKSKSTEATTNLSLASEMTLKPIDWLSAYLNRHADKFHENLRERLSYEMFVIPSLPWNSHGDIIVSTASSSSSFSTTPPVTTMVSSTGNKKLDNLARVHDSSSLPTSASDTAEQVVNPFSLPGCGEILYSYLQNGAFYNQLLEMLDGYLSTNSLDIAAMNSSNPTALATSVDFDLSVAVWDILQSLPSHSILLTQIKAISSPQLNAFFDPTSPFRLLYTLQIIESLFAQSVSLCFEPTKRSGDNNNTELMNWAMNFVEIGGAECVLNLIHTLSQKIVSITSPESTSEYKPAVESRPEFLDIKHDYVMPRKDIYTVLVALSSRILHMLLLLDPLYKNWTIISAKGSSSSSKIFRGSLFDVSTYPDAVSEMNMSTGVLKVPSGVIFSNIDPSNLIRTLFSVLLKSYDLFRSNKITSFAMLAASENIFVLLSGVLTALENGLELLRANSKVFNKIVFALCISCPAPIVRQGFCRRIFEVCANIYSKCADPSVSQDDKKSRLSLFDFIYYAIVYCADRAAAANSTAKITLQSSNAEQVYCLLACIESLRSSPNLIFPELSPRKKEISSSYPSTMSLDSFSEEDAMIVDSTILVDSKHSGAFSDESFKGSIDVDKICKLFAQKLVHHQSRESFHSTSPDGTLLGILRGLTILAHGDMHARTVLGKLHRNNDQKRSIISFLYVHCLFPDGEEKSNADAGRKGTATLAACQTRESREYTYSLLHYLCSSDLKNFARLVKVLSNQLNLQSSSTHDLPHFSSIHSKAKSKSHDSIATPFSPRRKSFVPWNYDPSLLVKDGGAYVGLSNQGGTCYMNSFIQQLYHSSNFAGGLLRISVDVEDSVSTTKSPPSEQESMIFQLQVMFGHLKLSQKRFYDTMPFCKSFIDYDGQPISLSEQKDINEFAGMLFDKMEHNKDCMNLLANTIQGKFVWKTRSIESSYRSEREENFYMITAEVKDKSSLETALELNAAEELFSGDNKIEDANGQKVEASRRCEIRSLPSTLIIHLKRFEFDLETMNRKKVNDYISFPFDLNMHPYTEEGIRAKELKSRSVVSTDFGSSTNIADLAPSLNERPPSYYNYKLRGVVAHVGAIDRGHYYSFIKERGTQKWYEFNDRLVIPFNPDNIPHECFGGVETVTNSNGVQSSRMRENNAYLLVYEREEYVSIGGSNKTTEQMIPKDTRGDSNSIHGIESSPLVTKPSLGERVQRFGESDDESNDYYIDNTEESNYTEESHTPPPKGSHVVDAKPVKEATINLDSEVELLGSDAIAKQVLDAVWTENTEFQKDRFLFDPIHFRFLWQMLKCASVNEIIERSSSSSSDDDELQVVLGKLCTVCLRFNVEVIARANGAQQCFLQFFQGVETIVMKDTSNTCAKVILKELVNLSSSDEPLTRMSVKSDGQSDSASCDGSNRDGPFHTSLDSFHPWLIQVYLHHPNTPSSPDSSAHSFPQAFTHLLMVCIRKLRPASYTIEEPVKHLVDSSRHQRENEDAETVSLLISTILRLLELFKIEDVISNDGKNEIQIVVVLVHDINHCLLTRIFLVKWNTIPVRSTRTGGAIFFAGHRWCQQV